jgi:predicted PurR-regulated permease PerM
MIVSLTLSAAAIAFVVNVLVSLLKRFVYPRFGSFGVHVVAFILAMIGAWYWIYGQNIESIATFVAGAFGIFSLAVTFYEVILKHIGFFKVKTDEMEEAREERHG